MFLINVAQLLPLSMIPRIILWVEVRMLLVYLNVYAILSYVAFQREEKFVHFSTFQLFENIITL